MRVVEGGALVVFGSGRGAVSAEDDVRDRGAALDGDARVRLAPRGALAAGQKTLALLRACGGGGGGGREGGGRGVSDARRGRSRAKNAEGGRAFGSGSRGGEGTRGDDAGDRPRTRASVPPRPYISTLRLSIPGRPPHRHTPPSMNHAQCPHRCLAAFRSEKPSSRASGSDSSGRRPRGAGASASSAGSLIARVERTRRDRATVDLHPRTRISDVHTRRAGNDDDDARADSAAIPRASQFRVLDDAQL